MSLNVFFKLTILLIIAQLQANPALGQKETLSFWEAPDSLHKGRFWLAAGTGVVAYTGTLIALNEVWYKDYPRSGFHTFDDWDEWQQMDKAGHMFTTYFEADWIYQVARWTGMKKKASILTGSIAALGIQTSLEILDGYSSQWGFSWSDMAFNTAGAGLWAGQQAIWDEQRIRMKFSTTYRSYPDEIVTGVPSGETTLMARTDELYGTDFFERLLKDYNAQTIWLSVNVHSFLAPQNKFPKWLNLAVGYGAENMFAGFENTWEADGNTYTTSDDIYPRHRQIVLSPDIDLSRLNIKSKPLKTLVYMLNIFKIPAPALVFNGNGGVEWDWLYF